MLFMHNSACVTGMSLYRYTALLRDVRKLRLVIAHIFLQSKSKFMRLTNKECRRRNREGFLLHPEYECDTDDQTSVEGAHMPAFSLLA